MGLPTPEQYNPDQPQNGNKPDSENLSVQEQITAELLKLTETLQAREAAILETVLFIPITGGEGSGKTTLLKRLNELLASQNITTHTIKMLGGNEMSDLIRQLVLSDNAKTAPTDAKIHLMQAAIATAAEQVHKLSLQTNGKSMIIFADRSPFDTAVYQVMADESENHNPVELAEQNLVFFLNQGILPTTTLIVDIDPEVGLARKHAQDEENWIEKLGLEYHQKIQAAFQVLIDANEDRPYVQRIDGNLTKEELQLADLKIINQQLTLEYEDAPVIGTIPRLLDAEKWVDESPERALRILQTPAENPMIFEQIFQVLEKIFWYMKNHTFETEADKRAFGQLVQSELQTNENLIEFFKIFSMNNENVQELYTHLTESSVETFIEDELEFATQLSRWFAENKSLIGISIRIFAKFFTQLSESLEK